MAFYIESRFVDIRDFVDFSDFNESDFYQSTTPAKPPEQLEKISDIISETVAAGEPTEPLSNESEPIPASVEIIDKTTLYKNFIIQKYDEKTATEFIKILLNPLIIILAYRYEFIETSDNHFSLNLRHLKNLVDRKLPDSDDDANVSDETRFQENLRKQAKRV